jgi:hypothetical protein
MRPAPDESVPTTVKRIGVATDGDATLFGFDRLRPLEHAEA